MRALASRTTVLALALLCLARTGSPLEGRLVLKDSGQPLADAQLSLLGRTGHVLTGADGRFVLAPTPSPPFEVLVTLPGGRSTGPIRVTSVPETGWVLEVAFGLEEAITVVSPAAPGIEGTPVSGLSLLSRTDVAERAPVNVAQALENVPGASSVSEGAAAVPALRGLSAGRTLVLLDGARVSSERRVGSAASFVDPAVLEAIEVARGPGALAYGSDAFGGVIQLRTRRAAPGTPLGGRLEGTLGGGGAPQQRVSLTLSRGLARGGVLAEGHYRNFEDWQSPQAEVPNSASHDYGLLLRFEHLLGGGLLSLGFQSDFGRDVGRPRDDSQALRVYYPSEDSRRLTASWERGGVGGFSRVGVNGFLGSYTLVTEQDRFASGSAPRSVERADLAAKDFHLRGYLQRPLGATRLEAGVDWNGRFDLEALEAREQYDLGGELAGLDELVAVEDAQRLDAALYASVEAPLAASLLLSAGVRADLVEARNQGGYFGDHQADNGAFSGFAALTLGSLGGFSATAQVARGFRDPTLSDRYYRGPTARGFITGNPDLEPENSLQLDLALRYASEGVRAALFAYQYEIEDLVERYQAEADFFFFRNRGEARVRGIEAEAQLRLPAQLSLQATAHLLSGRVEDDQTSLDGIPPEAFTLRLSRELGRGWAWLRVAGYGRSDDPGPTEQARSGYLLLDAAAGARLGSRVELRALARNLLDEAYLVSPDRRATLAPGRSLLLTLALRL